MFRLRGRIRPAEVRRREPPPRILPRREALLRRLMLNRSRRKAKHNRAPAQERLALSRITQERRMLVLRLRRLRLLPQLRPLAETNWVPRTEINLLAL